MSLILGNSHCAGSGLSVWWVPGSAVTHSPWRVPTPVGGCWHQRCTYGRWPLPPQPGNTHTQKHTVCQQKTLTIEKTSKQIHWGTIRLPCIKIFSTYIFYSPKKKILCTPVLPRIYLLLVGSANSQRQISKKIKSKVISRRWSDPLTSKELLRLCDISSDLYCTPSVVCHMLSCLAWSRKYFGLATLPLRRQNGWISFSYHHLYVSMCLDWPCL